MGDLVELKVTKHNDLIEAGYKLTLNEQRLVLAAVAQLDSRKPMPRQEFTITAAEFAKAFDIELKHAYEAMEDASDRLFERDIRTYDEKAQVRGRFRWISGVEYHDGEGKVTLGFSPQIAPYLTMLHARFTSYELKQVSRLGSAYAIRLYELLKQFNSTGERTLSIERLRQRLELVDVYPRFYDLKRWVIEPAMKEINANTDLQVEWDAERKGRKVVGLYFVFSDQQQLPL